MPLPRAEERIEFRTTREAKDLIERAAAVSGMTLTDFALAHLLDAAQMTLQEHASRRLSNRDRDIFLAMLEHEDELQANEAMLRAITAYRNNQ
ncbi:MAG: hypothetical protein AMXMBFR13_03980 [Phycisphaerae bacterium]